MSITFDTVLKSAEIDPASVHLVRHQDIRAKSNRTPYALWRNDRKSFELYQSIQRRNVFRENNFVASFVVPPGGETLFAGLYLVAKVEKAPDDLVDPIGGHNVAGHILYELVLDARLNEYNGKLVIDWGLGYRSWVQRGGRGPKAVVEVRRKIEEDKFPGYLRFITPLSEISNIYQQEWIHRLSDAKGVYLLTCPRTGEHYVGSATGAGGFYERWMQHAAMGGDAVRFKSRNPSDYQVSILEVAGSGSTDEDTLASEQLWIRKLQSVAMGLNGDPILRVSD